MTRRQSDARTRKLMSPLIAVRDRIELLLIVGKECIRIEKRH